MSPRSSADHESPSTRVGNDDPPAHTADAVRVKGHRARLVPDGSHHRVDGGGHQGGRLARHFVPRVVRHDQWRAELPRETDLRILPELINGRIWKAGVPAAWGTGEYGGRHHRQYRVGQLGLACHRVDPGDARPFPVEEVGRPGPQHESGDRTVNVDQSGHPGAIAAAYARTMRLPNECPTSTAVSTTPRRSSMAANSAANPL